MLCLFAPIKIKAQKKPFGNGLFWELNSGVLTISGNGAILDNPWRWHKDSVEKVIIEDGITKIGGAIFLGLNNLTSVIIPNSVNEIGESAFQNCSNLVSVTLPSSITTIKGFTFSNCHRLSSIKIPKSVKYIERGAFYRCRNFNTIHISDISSWCKIEYDELETFYPYHLYLNGKEVNDLVIPLDVTTISDCAFSLCKSISSVIIPNSVTTIGNGAFWKCSNLITVVISNSVTSIPRDAFSFCSSLSSVSIPSSVTSIGNNAFHGCTSLDAIEIPNSVKQINERNFRYDFRYAKGPTIIPITLTPISGPNKTSYYIVKAKDGKCGLRDADGKVIVPTEMEALESAGIGYLRYKLNGFWGLMNYKGKIIIDTDRGYTSIGDFKTFNKRFPYTMTGYKGECDVTGKQISKIKIEVSQQATAGSSNATETNNLYPFECYPIGKGYVCEMKESEINKNGTSLIKVSLLKQNSNYFMWLEIIEVGRKVFSSMVGEGKKGSLDDTFTMVFEARNGTKHIVKCETVESKEPLVKELGGSSTIIVFPHQSIFEEYDIESISYGHDVFPISVSTAATIKSMMNTLKNK